MSQLTPLDLPRRRELVARRSLWLAAAWLGLLLAAPWLAGRVLTADDLGAFHLPLRAFYQRELQRGGEFDWMPTLFGGFYLTGEGQVGSYHPGHWLLYRWLPLQAAFASEFLISYPILLTGVYAWLRRWRIGRAGALLAAVSVAFGNFSLTHLVHLNALGVVSHIPWLLWCQLELRRPSTARRALAGVILLTASQTLLGYPQYVWFSALAELVSALQVFRKDWTIWGIWMLGKGLGLGAGAIQILPTWEWLAASQRATEAGDFFVRHSFAPHQLLELVAPLGLHPSHEVAFYLGVVPLALLGLAWRESSVIARRWRMVCAIAAIAAFWFALGKYGGLFYLQRTLPVVGSFRVPGRYLMLAQLALAPLVARAYADWLRRPEVVGVASRRWLLGLILASLLGAGILWTSSSTAPGLLRALFATTPLGFLGIAWLLCGGGRGRALAPAAVAFVLALDTTLYLAIRTPAWHSSSLAETPNLAVPPSDTGERIAVQWETFAAPRYRYRGNERVRYGWRQIDGYAGLPPQTSTLGAAWSMNALRVANVRWALADAVPVAQRSQFVASAVASDAAWLEVPSPLPRARLVAAAQQSDFPAVDLPRIDPAQVALVDELPPLRLAPDATSVARLVRDDAGRIECEIETRTPQLLVVSERFHAGWRAWVDGEPTRVLRAYGDYQAVPIPAAVQRVELRFEPWSLRWGRWISGGSLALAVVAIGLVGYRRTS